MASSRVYALITEAFRHGVDFRPESFDPIATSEAFGEEQGRIHKLLYVLTAIMNKAGKKSHTVKWKVTGKIGEAVLKAAVNEKLDVLVTGTRGLGAVKRAFLGSVSDYLVKHALFPVVVYRERDN